MSTEVGYILIAVGFIHMIFAEIYCESKNFYEPRATVLPTYAGAAIVGFGCAFVLLAG
jgi:hypothetical protein